MALSWNPLGAPAPAAAPLPDFFGRSKTSRVQQLSLPKIPGADPMIRSSFDAAGRAYDAARADLGAYRRALAASMPMTSANLGAELADIGRYYDPRGYSADFAGIRSRRAGALAEIDDSIMRDLRRSLSSRAIGGGGTGSYLARLAAAESGKLRSREAYDAAAQERADLAALMAGRTSGYGRRASLIDADLARILNPMERENAALGAYNSNLGKAVELALANLISAYGVR